MPKKLRKGTKKPKGAEANYMTRNQAIRRLQVSLAVFRRLCILKGIYPRDPSKKPHGKDKTYYHTKDILFLLHEPILRTMREQKTHKKRVTRAHGKKDYFLVKQLIANAPKYRLQHIVKERYATFNDALRDLDDALCMVFLFASFPQTHRIPAKVTETSRRLALEFQMYVVQTRALRKVFLSIKGIYYQAELFGESITWLVPYQFSQELPDDVDFKVMLTFLEFYETLLRFVNFKLYTTEGLAYPPKLDEELDGAGANLNAIIPQKLGEAQDEAMPDADEENGEHATDKKASKTVASMSDRLAKVEAAHAGEHADKAGAEQDDEEDEFSADGEDEEERAARRAAREEEKREEGFKMLFSGLVVYLSREVPNHSLEFVIRSLGGTVVSGSDPSNMIDEADERITHHVVDRNSQGHRYLSRDYVQPQWVYDCVNTGILLPIEQYAPGVPPPPHLSPFQTYGEGDYVPEQATIQQRLVQTARGETPAEKAVEEESDEEVPLEEQYARQMEAEQRGVPFSQGPAAGAEDDDDEADAESGEGESEGDVDEDEEMVDGEGDEDEEEDDDEEEPAPAPARAPAAKVSAGKKRKHEEAEEEAAMSTIMMNKKTQRLMNRINYSQARKAEEVEKLQAKADAAKAQPAKKQKLNSGKGRSVQ